MNTRHASLLLYFVFILCFISVSVFLYLIAQYSLGQNIPVSASASQEVTVVIDAGHGGEDGGTVGVNGCYEKDINLSMALKLKSVLSSMGIRAVLTRDSDILLYDRDSNYQGQKKRQDMQKRLEITRSYENAIFISIHQNAFLQERYSGFQVYYSDNSTLSLDLARTAEAEVRRVLQPDNDRVAKASSGNIFLLDKLQCPAILIECGFLSNSTECALLCTEEYQASMCTVLAFALSSFLTEKAEHSK